MAENKPLITEETEVEFKNYNELSYVDAGCDNINLYVKNEFVGEIEVFTDRENGNREYICVNYEMVYLDTMTKKSV